MARAPLTVVARDARGNLLGGAFLEVRRLDLAGFTAWDDDVGGNEIEFPYAMGSDGSATIWLNEGVTYEWRATRGIRSTEWEPVRLGGGGGEGAEGPQGPAGPAGPQGVQGPIGPKGDTGDTGSAGAAGAQGAQGIQGVKGDTGDAGPQGEVGPAGADGADGAAGAQGIQGVPGDVGPQGIQGVPGEDGADGATGAEGPQGDVGPIGPAGPQGEVGPQGATGPEGDAGATGATGAAGPDNVLIGHTVNPAGLATGRGLIYDSVSGTWLTEDLATQAELDVVKRVRKTQPLPKGLRTHGVLSGMAPAIQTLSGSVTGVFVASGAITVDDPAAYVQDSVVGGSQAGSHSGQALAPAVPASGTPSRFDQAIAYVSAFTGNCTVVLALGTEQAGTTTLAGRQGAKSDADITTQLGTTAWTRISEWVTRRVGGVLSIVAGDFADRRTYSTIDTLAIPSSGVTDRTRRIENFYTGNLGTNVNVAQSTTQHIGPTVTNVIQGITLGVVGVGYFQLPEAGLYRCECNVWGAPAFAAGYLYTYWEVNGVTLSTQDGGGITNQIANYWSSDAVVQRSFAAGTYLRTMMSNGANGIIPIEARTSWRLTYLGKTA